MEITSTEETGTVTGVGSILPPLSFTEGGVVGLSAFTSNIQSGYVDTNSRFGVRSMFVK